MIDWFPVVLIFHPLWYNTEHSGGVAERLFASANPPGRKGDGLENRCRDRQLSKGFVYVLRCSDQRLYTGSTRDLQKRLEAHSMGKVRTTKNRRPFQLLYTEEFDDYSEARRREHYLKSGTGREWLKVQLEGGPSG